MEDEYDSYIKEPVKTGFVRWEIDVEHGTTVFTFLAYTRRGAIKKATAFLTKLIEKGQHGVG